MSTGGSTYVLWINGGGDIIADYDIIAEYAVHL